MGDTQSTGDQMQLWGDSVSRGQEQGREKGVEPRAEAQGSFRKELRGQREQGQIQDQSGIREEQACMARRGTDKVRRTQTAGPP